MKENAIEEQETDPVEQKEEPKRAAWELVTIKWLQLALNFNFFKYGKKAETLK